MSSISPPQFQSVVPKIDRPHSMLFRKGVQFVGDEHIDRFRALIYYFIVATGHFFCRLRIRRDRRPASESGKVVFVTRDWGTHTTMNREIYRSLEEYCDDGRVGRLELLRYDDIVRRVEDHLDAEPVSHVLLDTRIMITRAGRYGIIEALYKCFHLSFVLKQKGVVCICGITDIIEPGQRLFAELITSCGGFIVSWGSVGSHEVPDFRHQRIIGPLFLPISWRTWREFEEDTSGGCDQVDIAVIGSNYEPRKSFVEKLLPELKKNGISAYINIRKDLDYVNYLKMYAHSKIGFNTNWVTNQPTKLHFTHRNFEVMFTGALLLSQRCYGLDLYVQEGLDYVSFDGLEDLMAKVKYYLEHDEERQRIARSGQQKVKELFGIQYVWREVDKALRIFHYAQLPRSENLEANTP